MRYPKRFRITDCFLKLSYWGSSSYISLFCILVSFKTVTKQTVSFKSIQSTIYDKIYQFNVNVFQRKIMSVFEKIFFARVIKSFISSQSAYLSFIARLWAKSILNKLRTHSMLIALYLIFYVHVKVPIYWSNRIELRIE